MLVGAVVGFSVTLGTGQISLGLLAATLAGMGMALVFGFLVLTLQANQVATGLALTMFGVGVSAFLGRGLVGQTVAPPVSGHRIPQNILWAASADKSHRSTIDKVRAAADMRKCCATAAVQKKGHGFFTV